ncbi:MAG: hypothetical protein K2K89_07875 [Ruminococcus sp.]|nr:hypothetical protein [Ruminococcus sp.]
MNFEVFKILNRNNNNGINALVASIKRVYQGENSMYIEFESGRALELDFNGGYTKYNRNGKVASKCSINTGIRLVEGHIQLKVEGRTILIERLMAICRDIINDKMPTSYEGLLANVMDGSGSVFTASKLGIPVNYHPDNIEWCETSENSVHGSMIMNMKKITGHVYRYSADDVILRIIFSKNDNDELRNYCQSNLLEIK